MKFIKSYKIFESIDLELKKELKKSSITKYNLNEDGSIDCDQNVNFINRNITELPIIFNKVNGNFVVTYTLSLLSLKNCPKYIGGYFDCSHNGLKSLEYGPEYVNADYFSYNNKLITLKGCVEEVYGDFDCANNKLTSLEFCPMQVEGDFDCSNNKLTELDRSPFIRGGLLCIGMFKSEPEFNGSYDGIYWK